jgi:hypothetical protein
VSTGTGTLGIAEIDTAGAWERVEVGPGLPTAYAGATRRSADDEAVGWSVVAARLALTRGGRPLPPGGVLLGIDLVSHSLPPRDGRLEFCTRTDVTPHRSGRPLVRAHVRLRTPEGRDVAEVAFSIRWPGE